jgi:L-threonylcarbamoyladenylate synthase
MSQAEILPIDPVEPEPDKIAYAAALLRAGKPVAFPTETVYGLGANALDPAAVERVFAAKNRPAHDPMIVHIAGWEQLLEVATDIPPQAERLARAFWPGPLTLILRKTDAIPSNVTAGLDTVAVRMPVHPIAHALIAACGFPIAAPSANLFARPSPTTAAHVLEDLGERIELVIDGGPTPIGVESSVVDTSRQPPQLLRPGGISLEALEAVVPGLETTPQPAIANEAQAQRSPGQLSKHYAPRARLMLFNGAEAAALEHMRQQALALLAEGQRVGALITSEDLATLCDLPAIHVQVIGSKHDLAGVARSLFAALRKLDALKVDVILAHSVGSDGLGLAIQDRLRRAAGEGAV